MNLYLLQIYFRVTLGCEAFAEDGGAYAIQFVVLLSDAIAHAAPFAVTDSSVKIGWWSVSLSDNSLKSDWMIVALITFFLRSHSDRSILTVFGNQEIFGLLLGSA